MLFFGRLAILHRGGGVLLSGIQRFKAQKVADCLCKNLRTRVVKNSLVVSRQIDCIDAALQELFPAEVSRQKHAERLLRAAEEQSWKIARLRSVTTAGGVDSLIDKSELLFNSDFEFEPGVIKERCDAARCCSAHQLPLLAEKCEALLQSGASKHAGMMHGARVVVVGFCRQSSDAAEFAPVCGGPAINQKQEVDFLSGVMELPDNFIREP